MQSQSIRTILVGNGSSCSASLLPLEAALNKEEVDAYRKLGTPGEPEKPTLAHEYGVAMADGKVVAFINYRIADNYLVISGLYVAPAYRRKGISKQLIKMVAKATRGVTGAVLSVRVNNPAVGLYESLGFKATAFHMSNHNLEKII